MEKLQEKSPELLPIFNITEQGFKELILSSLNLDQLFYLECTANNVDIRDLVPKDRLLTWKQSLVRKGFLTEAGILTIDGKALLEAVGSGKAFRGTVDRRRLSTDEDFDRWWKTFPSSDVFEYKGKKFKGTKSMKIHKEKCKLNFHKIVNEGEVSVDDLVRCLEYEVQMRKEESSRTGENCMKWLRNTESYLNGRVYEGFIEVSKETIVTNQTLEDI